MISVCVATYNGAGYIRAQLESVLPQLSTDDEVIVSDDGSTDNTREIVQEINDPRIILLEGPRAGLIKNFEYALGQARGDIVFLCDQDDVWLPNKVERVIDALTSTDLVVTDCSVVNEYLEVVYPSFFHLNRSKPGFFRNLVKNGYLGCCMAVRRKILEAALPFPEKIAMHDWWIGLIAERVGRVSFVDEVLSLYRRHGNNVSPASMRSKVPLFVRLRWRVYLLSQIYSRLSAIN